VNDQQIITRYRDRIVAGQRTKLTKNDVSGLIAAFIEQLQDLSSEAKIKSLCEAEIALLEEGYPEATIAKVYLPKYRKAIKQAVAEGKLPMTESTSRHYTYTKRESGEQGEAHDHLSLDFLKYDNATYATIAAESAERNNEKQDSLKPVNPDVYLAKASELLRSDDPFELAAGIAATTGRRFSEVVDKGTLLITTHPYWVQFSGQLKKRSDADSFLTPCLVLAAEVMEAMERFRNHPRISQLAGMSVTTINRSLADSVRRSVIKHFGESGIIPVLEGEADVTIHNLRGVYGEICTHFFCPPSRGVARFVQERLGHVISEEELRRANSSATQHYFHYYLVDESGQHIGSRGVMLVEGEALPMAIELDEGELGEVESMSGIQPELKAVAMETIALPETSEMSMVEFSALSEQVQALTQEVQRLWGHINMNGQTLQTVPTPTDITFFTREIEGLRSRLVQLELERDQGGVELERLRGENGALCEQFEQERQVYQQRIEGLSELLKQPATSAMPTQAVVTSQAVLTEGRGSIREDTAMPLRSSVKGSPVRGNAVQRVEAALLLIQEWNRNHAFADRFAITQGLLQRVTGSYMPIVKQVMQAWKNEVYEHNSEQGVDVDRHNYGRDVGELKAFVQEKLG